MIQIAAAITPSADISGSAGTATSGADSSGGAPASFLSLLGRTMSSQAASASEPAGTVPGQASTASGAAVLVQTMVAADQTTTVASQAGATAQGEASKTQDAALLSALFAGKGKAEPKMSASDAQTAADSSPSNQSSQNPATDPSGLALMQSMLATAMASVPDKPAASRSGASGTDASSPADAVASNGQGGAKGQNLPTLMAGLAAQQAGQPSRVLSADNGHGQPAKQDQAAPDTKFLDILTAKAAGSAALQAGDGQTSQIQAAPTALTDTVSTALITPSVPGHVAVQPQTAATGSAGGGAVMMQSSFGSTGWTQELGDKMVWMAGNQGHTSELILNPPSLGTVEVRLHVNGNDAGAQFFSANADVRNAIEAAMPKLKEMLAGAGIALGEAMVSNQSFSQRESFQRQSQKSAQGGNSGNSGDPLVGGVSGVGMNTVSLSGAGNRIGLLDYYA